MKRQTTLNDIAKALKVSTSTVSRALKNDDRISQETKARVWDLAEKLSYRPNPFAISLQNKQSGLIGLIISEIDHEFFVDVINGILAQAEEEGYQVLTCHSQNTLDREKVQVARMLDAGVDGVLVCHTRETRDFSHFHAFLDQNIPLVLFDRNSEELDVPAVISDDFQGAQLAVNHLIETGRRKIMHIRGPEALSISFYRYMGYRETLLQHGIPERPEWVVDSEDEKGLSLLNETEWLDALQEIDAIFAFNDYAAYYAMTVLSSLGRTVPEDVALVGFGDLPMALFVKPTLSSVKQPAFNIGAGAVNELVKRIRYPQEQTEFPTKPPPAPPSLLPNTLIIRESSAS